MGAVSGNLAAVNFVQGKHGPYLRKRLTRSKKATPAQLQQRALFSATLMLWRTQPIGIRLGWNTLAKATRSVNRLGLPETISGFQLFLSVNAFSGWGWGTLRPQVPILAVKGTAPQNASLTSSAGGDIEVSFTQLGLLRPLMPPQGNWYFQGERSHRAVPTYYLKSHVEFKQQIADNGPQIIDLTAAWDDAFGHPFQGELISVRLKTYPGRGLPSPWLTLYAVTAA